MYPCTLARVFSALDPKANLLPLRTFTVFLLRKVNYLFRTVIKDICVLLCLLNCTFSYIKTLIIINIIEIMTMHGFQTICHCLRLDSTRICYCSWSMNWSNAFSTDGSTLYNQVIAFEKKKNTKNNNNNNKKKKNKKKQIKKKNKRSLPLAHGRRQF